MATPPDERPRVFSSMPSRASLGAQASHFALPTRGKVQVIPGMGFSSLLCFNFNHLWATALNWAAAGATDYFCLHHDDIEVRTHGWLDVMVEELRRVGAAVLSAVVPIKNDTGETSTAWETDNEWAPRKLTLPQCWALPTTFCAKDLPPECKGGRLLVNTGLMLVDVTRPEFLEADECGCLKAFFTIDDSVTKNGGGWEPRVKPEDWNFSRMCDRLGLPVYATTRIHLLHHGHNAWANYRPDEEGLDAAKAKEAETHG